MTYTSEEVVKITGFTYRQLDSWQRNGFLPFSQTPGTGYSRTYSDADVEWLLRFADALEEANRLLQPFGASAAFRFDRRVEAAS